MSLTTVQSGMISASGLSGSQLANNTVTAAQIANNTITSTQVAANTLSNTVFQTGSVENYMNSAGLSFGMRNRIINGAMGIWQRGTSFTGITNSPTYTADRWSGFVAAVITGEQIIQSSSIPSGQGFKYSAGFGRTAANTNTNSIWFVQLIESVNMLDLAGQSVTLSFWAKSGANYSGGNLSVLVNSGTSADQSLATFSAGPCTGYTGNASVINGSQALTTTWTKYTFTGSVGSTAQEIGVAFGYTPTGTAGADDNIYITGVQLEKGSTATSFDYRPYGTELALCQRYCTAYNADGQATNSKFAMAMAISTTNARVITPFPVKMRISPSLTVGATASVYGINNYSGDIGCNSVPVINTNSTTLVGASEWQVASGLTAGHAVIAQANGNNTAYLIWSAEL